MPVPTRKTAPITPQSAVRRARLVEDTIGRGLDLHQPFGIEEAANPQQGSDRPDGAEDLAMSFANLAPAARHGGEDTGPSHVVEARTDTREGLTDHPQALARLLVDVAFANGRSV